MSAIVRAIRNGQTSRENSPMLTLPRVQTTYMIIPTGGVIVPIIPFTVKTTPKCIGSMPAYWTTGGLGHPLWRGELTVLMPLPIEAM
jgi:hypothetical protein